MADIDIEKKNPVWPWILAAVIIAVILLIIFIDTDSADEEVVDEAPIENTTAVSNLNGGENLIEAEESIATVESYVTFINNNEWEMGLEHEYTHDALIMLTDAIESLANEVDYELGANLGEVRDIANTITEEPLSEQHGNRITEAFRILTDALMGMQQAYYPTLSEDVANMDEDVTRLEEIARNLNPDELTLEQKEIVKSYFNQAAQVLNEMN